MRATPLVLTLLVLAIAPGFAPPAVAPSAGLLPDLQTVVPLHLGIQNQQQREILRFSNGIANTGPGDLRMRPDPPIADATTVTNAVQELLDAAGNVVHDEIVSTFEFHPTHNHWHIGDVALFEVRAALDDGTGGLWGDVLVNDAGLAQSTKVTFCLIDWYALEGNSNTKDRAYFDCFASYQGIQSGWVDQYHQATDGQQVDITGAPAAIYYLASEANPEHTFLESDAGNNVAWQSFELKRESNGNPKIELVAHSECATPGLCGEGAPNR